MDMDQLLFLFSKKGHNTIIAAWPPAESVDGEPKSKEGQPIRHRGTHRFPGFGFIACGTPLFLDGSALCTKPARLHPNCHEARENCSMCPKPVNHIAPGETQGQGGSKTAVVQKDHM